MNSRETSDLPLAQPLTTREQEILNCIGDGLTNRQMAERLTIAAGTVKWYVRQVYNKLGVSSRAEAVVRARGLGLLSQEDQVGAVRNNLPLAATPFVGRERELNALAELIADPQVRIINIVGPGGIGKTRLALEAAGQELRPQSHFPNGIFFVSLAPLNSTAEIVSAMATAIEFHFLSLGNETNQLLSYLKQKKMLLIMDNFEHILAARTLLADVSGQAAGIKLLVTSRERLQLLGEQVFPLQGLKMPQSSSISEKALADSPSIQLFFNTAKRTSIDFQLLEGDAEHLLHICRLLGGVPLGLELAASWAGLLPLSEIAREIEQSLDLLTTKHHDVPSRHQSMQATLDISWQRLTSEQKRAFQELTVFRGGFTRIAALEVTGATLPLLITLINKSWLTYDRQNDRYNIHELLRQYGAGKLSTAAAVYERDVRERHSAYYCSYLQEREEDWFGSRQKEAAAEVRDRNDNIQRAWRWAANKGDGVLLAQGLHSLCRFFVWEGRKADGRTACRSAEEGLSRSPAAKQIDDAQRLAIWSQVLAWESEFVNEIAKKEKLLSQSQLLLDRAAQDGRDTRAEQAFIYLKQSHAAINKDYKKSIQIGTLGLELFRDLGDHWGEAESLAVVGGRYTFQGAFDQAHGLLGESLKIRRQLGDKQGIADTTINLGLLAQHKGNYAEAENLHRQSLRLYKQMENRNYESLGLVVLSFTQSWAGKLLAARDTAQQALQIDRALGNVPDLWSLIALITATIHLGRYSETLAKATESLEIARQRGHLAEEGFASMYLGDIAMVEGDLVRARDYLLAGASLLADLRYVYRSLPQASLSYMARAQGEGQKARDHLARALRSGIESHSMTPMMYCLPAAALLAADENRPRRAVELYSLAQQFAHITNSRWFEDIACRELDGVRASLPPDVTAAAEGRGRELDVWQTAETLLRELGGR